MVVQRCVCCCAPGWLSLWDCKFNSCHAIWSCRLAIFVIESQQINKIWQLDTFQAIKFLLKFLLHPGDSQICSAKFCLWLGMQINSKRQKKATTFIIYSGTTIYYIDTCLKLKHGLRNLPSNHKSGEQTLKNCVSCGFSGSGEVETQNSSVVQWLICRVWIQYSYPAHSGCKVFRARSLPCCVPNA